MEVPNSDKICTDNIQSRQLHAYGHIVYGRWYSVHTALLKTRCLSSRLFRAIMHESLARTWPCFTMFFLLSFLFKLRNLAPSCRAQQLTGQWMTRCRMTRDLSLLFTYRQMDERALVRDDKPESEFSVSRARMALSRCLLLEAWII
jgi:hypothetical protein